MGHFYPHDLRRSAVLYMRDHGLSDSDIMELAGWETREVFKRYGIPNNPHLMAVVAKMAKPSSVTVMSKRGVP